ncbi:MAG TPA: DUF3368 domain-containing protein [Thermoanaerobaculia bacterium]|nr:DUF3368 domain-containing protein [Thermoanaerobaculia bacterium]
MVEVLVADTSALIYFFHLKRLDLLSALSAEVLIPRRVLEELASGSEGDLLASEVRRRFVVVLAAELTPAMIEWGLGQGESHVLAVASARPGSEAVLDDRQARRRAVSIGVPVVGTLGLILRAKQRGLISAARPLVEELVRRKAFLSSELIAAALGRVGE